MSNHFFCRLSRCSAGAEPVIQAAHHPYGWLATLCVVRVTCWLRIPGSSFLHSILCWHGQNRKFCQVQI